MYRTRIFEIARERGLSDAELSRRMRLSPALISRVRSGERQIGGLFIRGALRAFPDLRFDDIFSVDPERERVPA